MELKRKFAHLSIVRFELSFHACAFQVFHRLNFSLYWSAICVRPSNIYRPDFTLRCLI
jgi:hypothetical protein